MVTCRIAFRQLLAHRWFTVGCVLSFALGIGVNTAAFAIGSQVLIQPLPYGNPGELVSIIHKDRLTGQSFFMLPMDAAAAISNARPGLQSAFAGRVWPYRDLALAEGQLRLAEASSNLLDLLQVRPALGRGFLASDSTASLRAVLLTDDAWRARYGAQSSIVGTTLRSRQDLGEIVGVLPRGFLIPSVNWASGIDGLVVSREDVVAGRPDLSRPALVARLDPGLTVERLQAIVDVALQGLAANTGASANSRLVVQPVQEGLFWNVRTPLMFVLGSASLVWLLASLNVGVLLAAHLESSRRIVALQLFLGAPATRIAATVLVKVAAVATIGGVLSLAVLAITRPAILALLPPHLDRFLLEPWSPVLLAWVGGAALLGTVIGGAFPVWRLARRPEGDWGHQFGRTGTERFRYAQVLVLAQIIVITAVVGVGVAAHQAWTTVRSVSLGYVPDGLFTASMSGLQRESARDILEVLRTDPIWNAAFVDSPIGVGEIPATAPGPDGQVWVVRRVTEGYHEALGVPLMAGRGFSIGEADRGSAVAVVSESVAAVLWPNVEPSGVIGRLVRLPAEPDRLVVGLARDTRERHGVPTRGEVLLPLGQRPAGEVRLIIREGRGPLRVVELVSRLSERFGRSPELTSGSIQVMIDRWLENPRMFSGLLGVFAFAGSGLTIVGLLALGLWNAQRRRKSFAIRLCLGASGRSVVLRALMQDLRSIVVGVSIGGLVAVWLLGSLQAWLTVAVPADGVSVAISAAIVGTLAIAATVLPGVWVVVTPLSHLLREGVD